MRLDIPTIFMMTTAVTFTVGVLFLLSWKQTRKERALLIWGAAHLIGSLSSLMLALRGVIADGLSIGIANALIITGYGLIWSGMRAFERQPLGLPWALAGGAVWLCAYLIPAFCTSIPARVILASTLAGLYCAAAAATLWSGRAEPLVSRYSALVLLTVYAGFYWIRIPLTLMVTLPTDFGTATPWFASFCFFGTLISVADAFVFMSLTKDRAEREQRLAAETDPLTGIANRRALVARAEQHLAAGVVALLLLDIDHFKGINDRYGHGVGDAVLNEFCRVIQKALPDAAVFGRMGGEEFACLLPKFDVKAAAEVAECLRMAVARLSNPQHPDLSVTVSIGVAAESQLGGSLDFLLRHADEALYRAKQVGRNCVVIADCCDVCSETSGVEPGLPEDSRSRTIS